MATSKTKSAVNDLQSLFDPKRYEGVYSAWARAGERLVDIAVDTGLRSTEITSSATQEALTNLRAATVAQHDLAGYGKAQADLVQKQFELFARSAQALGQVLQSAGTETSAVATEARDTFGSFVAANVDEATGKVAAATRKAA